MSNHKLRRIKQHYYAFLLGLGRQCDLCFGKSGAVRGNGIVVKGVIICDYCHCRSGWRDEVDAIANRRSAP